MIVAKKIEIRRAMIRIHTPRRRGEGVSIIEREKDIIKHINVVSNIYKLRGRTLSLGFKSLGAPYTNLYYEPHQ